MSNAQIHSSAVVDPSCELGPDVVIGPGCVLTGKVTLGAGVVLSGSNYVNGAVGPVTIGAGTKFWPHACVGAEPQDYKFNGITAGVTIGEKCFLREGATVHASTKPDRPTTLGDGVFMMVNSHIAHDCQIGNRVVLVNGALLAGHCEVGDDVTFGGNAVVHQFARIGRMVMMSGDCAVSKDVAPFFVVSERNRIGMLNIVGLRRKGFPRDQISALNQAFRQYLYRPMPTPIMVEGLRALGESSPLVAEVAEFMSKCKRGYITGFGKPERGSNRAARSSGDGADGDGGGND